MMNKKGILLLVSAFFAVSVWAHPPKKVTLTYADGKLKVVAEHSVSNPAKHYISEIKITVDGKDYKVLTFTSQQTPEQQVVEEAIPDLKAGDKITVKAKCDIFGSKKAEITVN
jgi:hypothetical protein